MKTLIKPCCFILFFNLCFDFNGFGQNRNTSRVDTTYPIRRPLPGQIPSFAMPVAYDFGRVSNIQLSTDLEESVVSGGLSWYRKHRGNDCEDCIIGNQLFTRGKLTFPDNTIRKDFKFDNYSFEIGYRRLMRPFAKYDVSDVSDTFDVEDTCCMYNYCYRFIKKRAFRLDLDYSLATEHWWEFGGKIENIKYNQIINGSIKSNSIYDPSLTISYNAYRKFNTRILNKNGHWTRFFKYAAFKANTQIGMYNNTKKINSFYSIVPSSATILGGQTVYSEPEEVLETIPNQGIGGTFGGILAVGFTDFFSIAITPSRLQAFESSISDISNSNLRFDILFKLPKTDNCDGNWTRNVTVGLNVKFQTDKHPVYGFGATIPFEE